MTIGKSMSATHISLENFDFAFNSEVNEAQVRQLATADFIDRGENVLIIGGPATGKSHIARVIEQAARQRGLKTVEIWLSASVIADLDLLASGFGERGFKAELLDCDLLIIDEADKRIASLLVLTLLRQRARLGKSSVLTSYSSTWDGEMNRELVTNQTNGYLPSFIATESGDSEWVALLNPQGFDPKAFGPSDQSPHLLEVQTMLAATGAFCHTLPTGERSYREFLRSQGQLV